MIQIIILLLTLTHQSLLMQPVNPRPTVHRIVAGNSMGSGVAVATHKGQTLILTANHVVKDGGPYSISGKPAEVIATDKTWDLAALVVNESWSISTLSKRPPKLGDILTVCGFGSRNYAENTGRVVNFFSPGGSENDYVAMDAKARSGDSGGPLFYLDGTVAAILFGTDNLGAHGTHCIRVRKFLSTVKTHTNLIKAIDLEYNIYGRTR